MTKTLKKTMVHPLDGQPTEMTRLMPDVVRPHRLSYLLVFFFMLNRSINLVMYKALTTFSYFFSQYFAMNYTLFALVAIMNFPGNLLNMACVPFYTNHRIKHVMIIFELLLAASCALIVPFHFLAGLLLCRLVTGFAVTAVRTEVNATIGAFTNGDRRTRAISIIEMSFALSSAGFLVVGSVLHWLGWQTFFLGTAGLICVITLLIVCLVPSWHLKFETGSQEEQKFESKKKAYDTKMLSECLGHKRLLAIFGTILLNKIARNAFYYTFSKWLAEDYGLNVQQTGFVTLTMAAGHFCGSAISPPLVKGMGIYGACVCGALLQVASMCVEPTYYYIGHQTPLLAACAVVFCYFCGCQLWYNNLLDICFSVTPRRNLFPAVQTILLACGSLGGSIGTIGSTFWYEWGNEAAIATICAGCNLIIVGMILMLYVHYRRHQKMLQSGKKEDQERAKGKYIKKPLKKEDKERVHDEFDASTMVIVTSNDILAPSAPVAVGPAPITPAPDSSLNSTNTSFGSHGSQETHETQLSHVTKLSESLEEDEILRANFVKLDIDFGAGISIEPCRNDRNLMGYNSAGRYGRDGVNGINARQFRSVSVQTSPISQLWTRSKALVKGYEEVATGGKNEIASEKIEKSAKKQLKNGQKRFVKFVENEDEKVDGVTANKNSKMVGTAARNTEEDETGGGSDASNASDSSNVDSDVSESFESKNEEIDSSDAKTSKCSHDHENDMINEINKNIEKKGEESD